MAHLDKYDRKQLRKISRETYRELEQDKYKNYVDSTRTNLNYSMKGYRSSKEFIDALDDRTQFIIDHDMDGKPPRNDPKYGSWVITCPEQLQGDPAKVKKFFELFYDFTGERYGRENLVDCVVHMDETSPHATAYIVPACTSRKSWKKSISAATVFSLKDMKTFHHDFNKVCEKAFGIPNMIMRAEEERENDPRDLSLKEYKQEQEQRKQEAEQEATGIKAKAEEQAAKSISEAETQAARIVEAAEAKAARIRYEAEDFEHRRMKEARWNIYFTNNKLAELRQEAKKIKEDTENGFGKVEDEMILSLVEEAGQRDALIMQYKRRHPLQDADRVVKAKETAIKQARRLPDIRQITCVFPVNPDKQGIYMTDEQYDEFEELRINKDNEMDDTCSRL